ncbi:MAG: 1-deoxy-D-xylulose-5-phosphate reductoisomerase [Clostridia bacterium]
MEKIAILGSTGSIGTQALSVIREHQSEFKATLLAAYGNNVEQFAEQIIEFSPKFAVIIDEKSFSDLQKLLPLCQTKFFCGMDELLKILHTENFQKVLVAFSGISGLLPTIAAIEAGHSIALANKETLVAAGDLVMELAKAKHVQIIPVDSEHSAIFQCLQKEENSLSKVILTCSGGPFCYLPLGEFKNIKPAQALKHPKWSMGSKITIDSASLMNKGLEIIEAHHLFHIAYDKIEVLIHPECIVHSLIELVDGAVLAQMGLPDMRLPIQYAFTYPERISLAGERLNLAQLKNLSFLEYDRVKFPSIRLAKESGTAGGLAPCIFNAANEAIVPLYLAGIVDFLSIFTAVERALEKFQNQNKPDLPTILATDLAVKKFVQAYYQAR